MPNVTITVPEEMKAEMDKYSEVSWSEICRIAISQYIAQRENPQPLLDIEPRLTKLNHYDYDTGYATLTIDLRILNRMSLPIVLDRILAKADANATGKTFSLGQTNDLRRNEIDKNSVGYATLQFPFPREKLLEFEGKFTKTFDCRVECAAFVDGFKDSYWREFRFKIPIDVWNETIEKALKKGQENQATQ